LTAITLPVVAASVIVHRISVTPLLRRYGEKVAGCYAESNSYLLLEEAGIGYHRRYRENREA
jgi:hypothetical protein